MKHDTGYKLLFSHPEMVRDLLCDWVPGDWLAEADFSTLERMNASYIAENEKERHDDMVWRLRLRDRWLWVYLVLEFQSEADRWMALRMLVYAGLLAQDLVRRGELSDGKLPPILPVVLYNGQPMWSAPTNVRDLFVAPPPGLADHQPNFAYHLIDEARLDHGFERGLTDVSATYARRDDGGIDVLNRGFDVAKGAWREARGRAYFIDRADVGSLKVSFFGPFYGGWTTIPVELPEGVLAHPEGARGDGGPIGGGWRHARRLPEEGEREGQERECARHAGFSHSFLRARSAARSMSCFLKSSRRYRRCTPERRAASERL